MNKLHEFSRTLGPACALLVLLMAGCTSAGGGPSAPTATAALQAVTLEPGEKLRVVATTTIVGDVVRQVGGDRIEITTLLPPGADPHSYQARPDDLRKLNGAKVVFVNGLHLEEAMEPTLDSVRATVPVVEVNDGVPVIEFGEHEEGHETAAPAVGAPADEHGHDHGGVDPHTWMDVGNVVYWVDNVTTALGTLDPAGAADYAQRATAYKQELTTLDGEIRTALAGIPPERRKLVTDHDNLSYLAQAYGLEVIGSVIPAISTMATASAQERAALQRQIQEQGVPAILVDATVNAAVAQQLATDTGAQVVTVYTGSLSAADGPAPTYVEMMRHAAEEIVQALK